MVEDVVAAGSGEVAGRGAGAVAAAAAVTGIRTGDAGPGREGIGIVAAGHGTSAPRAKSPGTASLSKHKSRRSRTADHSLGQLCFLTVGRT